MYFVLLDIFLKTILLAYWGEKHIKYPGPIPRGNDYCKIGQKIKEVDTLQA